MECLLKYLKLFLMVWGGISFIGLMVIGGFIAYKFSLDNRNKTDSASIQDVRFVLNWCELGEKRIDKIIHSYQSSRSFTGDHLDAYAIRITNVTINELIANTDDTYRRWYRGDQLPKVLDDAVSFVGSWLGRNEISWFPEEVDLRSSGFYVYPCNIYYHGTFPTEVEIIFIRPSDKMVFFFSAKT